MIVSNSQSEQPIRKKRKFEPVPVIVDQSDLQKEGEINERIANSKKQIRKFFTDGTLRKFLSDEQVLKFIQYEQLKVDQSLVNVVNDMCFTDFQFGDLVEDPEVLSLVINAFLNRWQLFA